MEIDERCLSKKRHSNASIITMARIGSAVSIKEQTIRTKAIVIRTFRSGRDGKRHLREEFRFEYPLWTYQRNALILKFKSFSKKRAGQNITLDADLIRQIRLPQQVGFLEITHSEKSEFLTEIMFYSSFRVEGTHLLIVEDILDTGITLAYLHQQLESKGPKSIRICTFLDKPDKRKVDIQPDYCGFAVPNRHVVGYGLDFEGRFRNLPYLTYVE
mgnify:CR=1 FL=1